MAGGSCGKGACLSSGKPAAPEGDTGEAGGFSGAEGAAIDSEADVGVEEACALDTACSVSSLGG